MQADPTRKVEFDQQRPNRRSLSEFFVDFLIGFFHILALPFKWLSVQMGLVMADKKKKDSFTKWLNKQQRRENRRLRYNNEF